MGDGDHGAGELLQELLEPFDALGIEVIRRLVEQQHVRLRQQQPAQRDAALLTARQLADFRVPRRQPQRVRGDFHLHVRAGTRARDDRLQLRLLGGERVEIGVGLRIGCIHLVEALRRGKNVADAFLDDAAHRRVGIELRLLRQEADAHVGHRHRFAVVFLVLARHDLQQAGLARSVQAQDANLGAWKERQRNILQDDALGRDDLAHTIHRVNVLSHGIAAGCGVAKPRLSQDGAASRGRHDIYAVSARRRTRWSA